MDLNRYDLKAAYTILPLNERQRLSDHMNCTMQNQRRYFLDPYSDKIGKKRLKKLLDFYPEETWLSLAKEARSKSFQPIELNMNWPELVNLPDIIVINGKRYSPIVD